MMEDSSTVPNKKVAVLEKRESTFGSANGRTRSYQEEAAVAPELRSRLESIGMRTRFNVSRGYGSPPPSQCHEQLNAQNSTFASETQILQSVKNTRNAWNRTKSAPMYSNELIPFCGLRADIIEHVHQQDENEDPKDLTMAIKNNQAATSDESIGFMDLKRNRDEIFQDWANEEADSPSAMQVDNKVIAALPRRHDPSFHSSSSSSSPFVRHRTLPISSNLSSYLSSAQDSNIDFSSFTNRSDF